MREERQVVRSEASFLPFSKNTLEVAPEIQRLTFFFWYLFFLWQDKKKSTQINYHFFASHCIGIGQSNGSIVVASKKNRGR